MRLALCQGCIQYLPGWLPGRTLLCPLSLHRIVLHTQTLSLSVWLLSSARRQARSHTAIQQLRTTTALHALAANGFASVKRAPRQTLVPLSYTVYPVPYTGRSHAVEFLTGSRVCDFDDASVRCAQLRSRGGWGPTAPGQDEVPIPNLNVHFLNNIIANPPDNTTQWNHMEVGRRGRSCTAGGRPLGCVGRGRLGDRLSAPDVGSGVGPLALGWSACWPCAMRRGYMKSGGEVASHTGVARLRMGLGTRALGGLSNVLMLQMLGLLRVRCMGQVPCPSDLLRPP